MVKKLSHHHRSWNDGKEPKSWNDTNREFVSDKTHINSPKISISLSKPPFFRSKVYSEQELMRDTRNKSESGKASEIFQVPKQWSLIQSTKEFDMMERK